MILKFSSFVCLNVIFISLQLLLLLLSQHSLMGNKNLLWVVATEILGNYSLILSLSWFVVAAFILHLLLLVYVYCFLVKVAKGKKYLIVILFFCIYYLILFSVSRLYQFSHFAFLKESSDWIAFLFIILLLILTVYAKAYKQLAILAFVAIVLAIPAQLPSNNQHLTKSKKPNIILIGIDALRPDHLGYNSFGPSVTPNIDKFLSDSLNYSDSYTPLGRTYPAWMSILSGNFPTTHQARFNLTKKDQVDRVDNIQSILKRSGYYTIYGLDERRFNNIDEDYGFDQVVGPKIGAADFFISVVSDLPLVNLVSNSIIGKYMFPYIYNNRGNYKTYKTSTFQNELEAAIDEGNGKPLFLATHFTMPHWPFFYSEPIDVPEHPFDIEYATHYFYLTMLKKADQQFSDYITMLKRKGTLDNAIVVLLSDHGESFGMPKYALKKGFERVNFVTNSHGHGTNILTLQQYHVLLSIKGYGSVNLPTGKQNEPVSLVDIVPTVDKLLGLGVTNNYQPDGKVLPPFAKEQERYQFVESSFSVDALSKGRVEMMQVLAEGINSYTTDEDGLAIYKPSLMEESIKAKQRGIIYKDWLLAVFPEIDDDAIIVNRKTRTWWPVSVYDEANPVPWRKMLDKLCAHYKNDPGMAERQVCTLSSTQLATLHK